MVSLLNFFPILEASNYTVIIRTMMLLVVKQQGKHHNRCQCIRNV